MKLGWIKEKRVAEWLGQGLLLCCLLNKTRLWHLWIFVTFWCQDEDRSRAQGRGNLEQLGKRWNASFERVQNSSTARMWMKYLAFLYLIVVSKAQGPGCQSRVLLGSRWVGGSDSWSQKKIAGSYQICPALSWWEQAQQILPATGFLSLSTFCSVTVLTEELSSTYSFTSLLHRVCSAGRALSSEKYGASQTLGAEGMQKLSWRRVKVWELLPQKLSLLQSVVQTLFE